MCRWPLQPSLLALRNNLRRDRLLVFCIVMAHLDEGALFARWFPRGSLFQWSRKSLDRFGSPGCLRRNDFIKMGKTVPLSRGSWRFVTRTRSAQVLVAGCLLPVLHLVRAHRKVQRMCWIRANGDQSWGWRFEKN
jgi:hypothetical protein